MAYVPFRWVMLLDVGDRSGSIMDDGTARAYARRRGVATLRDCRGERQCSIMIRKCYGSGGRHRQGINSSMRDAGCD